MRISNFLLWQIAMPSCTSRNFVAGLQRGDLLQAVSSIRSATAGLAAFARTSTARSRSSEQSRSYPLNEARRHGGSACRIRRVGHILLAPDCIYL